MADRNQFDLSQFPFEAGAERLNMPQKDLTHVLAVASTLALAFGAILILFTM